MNKFLHEGEWWMVYGVKTAVTKYTEQVAKESFSLN